MDIRHAGGCPDVIFSPKKAARGLEAVLNQHPDASDCPIYVIALPGRGKAHEPNTAFRVA